MSLVSDTLVKHPFEWLQQQKCAFVSDCSYAICNLINVFVVNLELRKLNHRDYEKWALILLLEYNLGIGYWIEVLHRFFWCAAFNVRLIQNLSFSALYTTQRIFTMVATSTLNRNWECLSGFAGRGYDLTCIDHGKI